MKSVGLNVAGLVAVLLSGCATTSIGPTVTVTPGPHKDLADFRNDQTFCMGVAQQQIAGAQQQLNSRQSASALLAGAVGALDTVAGGDSSGAGVASGAANGAADGDQGVADARANLQQSYDAAFGQCMYSKGDLVPGYETAAVEEAPVGPDRALVRATQLELIRLGYLGGGADGALGPRTRGAIDRFEQTAGLAVDGTVSPELLRALRSSTAMARTRWVAPTATKASAEAAGSNWVAPGSTAATTAPASTSAATPASNWVAPPPAAAPANH